MSAQGPRPVSSPSNAGGPGPRVNLQIDSLAWVPDPFVPRVGLQTLTLPPAGADPGPS